MRQYTNSDLILDETTDVIVPEWRMKKAAECAKIRMYLSHSQLKKIIREIDGAPNHKKKMLLRKRMRNDPPFQEFIDDLLKEMGYINENGQFEVKLEERPP